MYLRKKSSDYKKCNFIKIIEMEYCYEKAIYNGGKKNNLYIGNLYSLKDTGKIAVGIEVDPSNYGLSSSLVNGVKSDINHGESVVNFEDLLINETYYEIIGCF